MGLDGGGTKTECVLMNEARRVLGRGRGGPSNPSRIGVEAAARGVQEAVSAALSDARLQMSQVSDVCAGLAGVADASRAAAMKQALVHNFAGSNFELCTDLDLALAAAGTTPAIVLVAGTGSAAVGRDIGGRIARSGGHGPQKGDEGSAFAVGKSAMGAVQSGARDFKNEELKSLRAGILEMVSEDELTRYADLKGEAADAVFPRVYPVVVNASDCGNEIARKLLNIAAIALAGLVDEVQRELKLTESPFLLGKTGGMIRRSSYFDERLDKQLRRVAPQATIEILQTPLAEVAARRALSL